MVNDGEISDLDHNLFAECQTEHIFPDEPSKFDPTTFGFNTDEDYETYKHQFGNLIPLEERLNRRAQNVPPADKPRIYAESRLAENRVLGTRIGEDGFRREQQNKRTEDIVRFFKTKWAISLYK